MHFSRAEMVGWALAIILVIAMGFIALHGPFEQVNSAAPGSGVRPETVPTPCGHEFGTVPDCPTPAPTGTAIALTVDMVDDPVRSGDYEPRTVRVKAGETVVFKNVSNAPHTVTEVPDELFNSGFIATNGQWKFTPTKTGTFNFYCEYHPKMVGKLVVES